MKSAADTILLTGEHLPVIGDAHPLRMRYRKILISATVIACFIHLAGFGGWLIGRNYHREPERAPMVRIVKIADLGVPPSLSHQDVSAQVNISNQVAPPSIGVPEPVPDFQAPNLTMASQQEMAQALTPTDLSQLGNGGGDSLVVQLDSDKDNSPSPDQYSRSDLSGDGAPGGGRGNRAGAHAHQQGRQGQGRHRRSGSDHAQ